MQRILIIEDDEDIAAIERDYLELNGFQVEIAADGLAGLEQGLRGAFDLILLDLMLPGMDGFSVCRRLREEKDVPILMVTARREDIDKIRGLGLGADDYIEKPFSPSVLVARVRAHLTRRVFADGREVELKTREFELLQFSCSTRISCSAGRNSTRRSGAWRPWETTPPWPSTSTASGRRSSPTPAVPDISRRYGARATASAARGGKEGIEGCGSCTRPVRPSSRA